MKTAEHGEHLGSNRDCILSWIILQDADLVFLRMLHGNSEGTLIL